jgi:methylase of polypeptide subunit release factors
MMLRRRIYKLQARTSLVQRAHHAVIKSRPLTRALFGVEVLPVDTEGYFDLTTVLMLRALRPRVERSPDARLLEIGVGGFAVLSGALGRLTSAPIDACDINAKLVEQARRHVELNHLNVNVFASDLFAAVPTRRYDLVFWNLPYWANPDLYLPGLFAGTPDHLSPSGQLAIGYNSHRLSRRAVLDRLDRAGGLAVRSAETWWWNLHEVLFLGLR